MKGNTRPVGLAYPLAGFVREALPRRTQYRAIGHRWQSEQVGFRCKTCLHLERVPLLSNAIAALALLLQCSALLRNNIAAPGLG